jgi:hypothetical protein
MSADGYLKQAAETIELSASDYFRLNDKVGELIEVKPNDWRFLHSIEFNTHPFPRYHMVVVAVAPIFIKDDAA